MMLVNMVACAQRKACIMIQFKHINSMLSGNVFPVSAYPIYISSRLSPISFGYKIFQCTDKISGGKHVVVAK